MAEAELRRTVRRCVALVLIALSLPPMLFVARFEDSGVTYSHVALEFGDDVALVLFAGAVLYLLGSVVGLPLARALEADG